MTSTQFTHFSFTQLTVLQVSENVLKKVLERCSQHKNDPAPTHGDNVDLRKKTTDIEEWDQKFMQVNQEMLFEIILAANYMDIKALLGVGCKTVANMIKSKSPEEIRKTFNIQNDFTPDIRKTFSIHDDFTSEEDQIHGWLEGRNLLKNGRGRRSNPVINSQEGRNLLQKTAGL